MRKHKNPQLRKFGCFAHSSAEVQNRAVARGAQKQAARRNIKTAEY